MFYWQKRTWTCGPAALRIVLHKLKIKKTEEHLARLLDTTRLDGTKNKAFAKVARHYNLRHVIRSNSSLNEVFDLMQDRFKVIVAYFCPINNCGHYAVVNKIGRDYIHLLDPSLGPKIKYKKSYFISLWYSEYEKDKRWFIAFKRRGKL